jgi:hypothetical protein
VTTHIVNTCHGDGSTQEKGKTPIFIHTNSDMNINYDGLAAPAPIAARLDEGVVFKFNGYSSTILVFLNFDSIEIDFTV